MSLNPGDRVRLKQPAIKWYLHNHYDNYTTTGGQLDEDHENDLLILLNLALDETLYGRTLVCNDYYKVIFRVGRKSMWHWYARSELVKV